MWFSIISFQKKTWQGGKDVSKIIKFVVLIVDEKTLIERDKQRPVDCQMGERSLILLREVLEENFDEHNILNSSKLNIKQTTQKILQDDRFLI